MARIVYEELSRKIIGAAMEVLNNLKLELDLALLINFKNTRLESKTRFTRAGARGSSRT